MKVKKKQIIVSLINKNDYIQFKTFINICTKVKYHVEYIHILKHIIKTI